MSRISLLREPVASETVLRHCSVFRSREATGIFGAQLSLLYPESVNREEIVQGCLDQAGWAAKLGSPMYEALLRRMAENVRAGRPCLAALESHMVRSRMLAPLLLLAAIHRMVLEGQLPEAARFYPSAGGRADEDALWPHLLEAVPHTITR